MPPVSANAVGDDAVRLIVDYLQAQQKKSARDARKHLDTAHATTGIGGPAKPTIGRACHASAEQW
jgi:hypothetical protein